MQTLSVSFYFLSLFSCLFFGQKSSSESDVFGLNSVMSFAGLSVVKSVDRSSRLLQFEKRPGGGGGVVISLLAFSVQTALSAHVFYSWARGDWRLVMATA